MKRPLGNAVCVETVCTVSTRSWKSGTAKRTVLGRVFGSFASEKSQGGTARIKLEMRAKSLRMMVDLAGIEPTTSSCHNVGASRSFVLNNLVIG